MRYAKRLIPTALLAIAATAVGIACTSAGDESDGATQAALKGNPGGNNGTVKIQEQGDPLEIPDNDPHVGCKFQIEFRGFDKDVGNASWALEGQAPTGKDIPVKSDVVDIGEDDATGGANDVDAVVPVDFTNIDLEALLGPPHPKQGFHLKLTVHAPGSKGADTKHKVFWVKDCFTPPKPDCGPKCGDGHKDEGEQCDLGDQNGVENSGCSATCTKVPICGDGCKDEGEECDEGANNGPPPAKCSTSCKLNHYCGDGCLDEGEECDLGDKNGGKDCTEDCKIPKECKDGGVTW